MPKKLCVICGRKVEWIVKDVYDPIGAVLMSNFFFDTEPRAGDIGICLPCFETGREKIKAGRTDVRIALN